MSEEPKLCPFCKEEVEIISWGDDPKSDHHFIGCYSRKCSRLFDEGLETGFYKTIKGLVRAWNRRGQIMTKEEKAIELAKLFHETYERLAPDFGYETRKESRKKWYDVPEKNRKLMIAVAGHILAELESKPELTEVDITYWKDLANLRQDIISQRTESASFWGRSCARLNKKVKEQAKEIKQLQVKNKELKTALELVNSSPAVEAADAERRRDIESGLYRAY